MWHVACLVPSHYLNRCWFTVTWITGDKFHWNLNQIQGFACKLPSTNTKLAPHGLILFQAAVQQLVHVNDKHYNDVITDAMASQITGLSVVCLTVCSGADQRKHQSPASLAFVRGIHRWPVNSPHEGPVMLKMFPFDDVIMKRRSSLLVIYLPSNAERVLISRCRHVTRLAT